MGLMNKIAASASGRENVRISYVQMVDLVRTKFIDGADDEFLKQVEQSANGGLTATTVRDLQSKSGMQVLKVTQVFAPILYFILGKEVTLIDDETNKIYDIRSTEWRKFYDGILTAIEAEKRMRK